MRSFLRILALTTVALLLAGTGAWACCDNGLVDCCDMESSMGSGDCPDTQAMTMDCGLDHSLNAAIGTVSAKTVDPSQATQTLAQFGPSTTLAEVRSSGALSATRRAATADLYTLLATLRL